MTASYLLLVKCLKWTIEIKHYRIMYIYVLSSVLCSLSIMFPESYVLVVTSDSVDKFVISLIACLTMMYSAEEECGKGVI